MHIAQGVAEQPSAHREAQIDHLRRVAAECGLGVGIHGRKAALALRQHQEAPSAAVGALHALPNAPVATSHADDDAASGVWHTR